MSTAPPESSHPETDHGECPNHTDLLKYQSMPERLSGWAREKIAAHIRDAYDVRNFVDV